jgi:chromosome segregation ATPase
MASFRDRFLTPRVARAITSPSAIVATGAGAAVGVLAFGNPLGAVALGVAAFTVRVLAAVPRGARRAGISPNRLEQPWRGLVEEVLDARSRFEQAIGEVRPGPLADRLSDLRSRLDAAVDEVWRTASAGDSLSEGRRRIDAERVRADLATAGSEPPTERSAARLQALRSQLESAERLDATIADTYDRLRLLDARIDETVTRAVELSVTQHDGAVGGVGGLGAEVDSIVVEMEALRQAVEETRRSATA